MAGVTITGKPRSGKSLWLKKVGIPDMKRRKIRVAVLDPILGGLHQDVARAQWGADWVTNDPIAFHQAATTSNHCAFVVDEVAYWAKNYKWLSAIEYIAVAGGNRGNLGIFVAQRIMMIHPNIKNLCDAAVVFRQREKDLEELASLLDEPAVIQAKDFAKGQYMMVEPFKTPVIHNLFHVT